MKQIPLHNIFDLKVQELQDSLNLDEFQRMFLDTWFADNFLKLGAGYTLTKYVRDNVDKEEILNWTYKKIAQEVALQMVENKTMHISRYDFRDTSQLNFETLILKP